jgi:hypothetical protein
MNTAVRELGFSNLGEEGGLGWVEAPLSPIHRVSTVIPRSHRAGAQTRAFDWWQLVVPGIKIDEVLMGVLLGLHG